MKRFASIVVLLCLDMLAIVISLVLAYMLRDVFGHLFPTVQLQEIKLYLSFDLIYAVTILLFAYEGLYTRRYDFWHESRLIFKALIFAFFIVLSYLALTKTVQIYSRAVIVLAFILMAFFVPLFKNAGKKLLFKIGLWQREAKIYGSDPFIKKEIFGNPYLGYVEARRKEPKTVFVNSRESNARSLSKVIEEEIRHKHEVIFIPLLTEYNLTQSQIYELSNTRTNLVVVQNRMKSRYRIWLKNFSDMVMLGFSLPLLIPILAVIAVLIRREEPGKTVFFKQERLGQKGSVFTCLKFRTMYEDGDRILKEYLAANPEEAEYYAIYHKYKEDPRITKIGSFLRRTSLDELPQIFNVLRGEMSFIGPRPYMLREKEKIGDTVETVLTAKPGITGLWQVSGRSGVDFRSRVSLDVWYIRNWSLWLDAVVLFKTFKVVFGRKGAY